MHRKLVFLSSEDFAHEAHKIGIYGDECQRIAARAHTLSIKLDPIPFNQIVLLRSLAETAALGFFVASRPLANQHPANVIMTGSHFAWKHFFALTIPNPIHDLVHQIRALVQPSPLTEIQCRNHHLSLDKTLLMGILNVTPDSFSDGGQFNSLDTALRHAEQMIREGADILDIGGESTRPGAQKVNSQQEIDRVTPIIEALVRNFDIPLSIDTYKASTAKACLQAGAHMINDISGLQFDDQMASTVAAYNDVPIVLMHIQGTPEQMQINPYYEDTIEEIIAYMEKSIAIAKSAGILSHNIILDPGIGFGKRFEDNVEIMRKLPEIISMGYPLLFGSSRKRFIDHIVPTTPQERLPGTAATQGIAIMHGAHILRVHDVAFHRQFIDVMDAIMKPATIFGTN